MNLCFDLKYAWRLLKKSWGNSLLCVGIVALSVGLTTFMLTLSYNTYEKPLGFPGAQNWYTVQIAADSTAEPKFQSLDAYTYQEMLKTNRAIQHLGAMSAQASVLSEGQESVSLSAAAISPSLLRATQIVPPLGRLFTEKESQSGTTPVVILSFDTWQTYFSGDSAVVGKQARINGKPMQIIGVMPKGFSLVVAADLWLPLEQSTLLQPSDSMRTVEAFIDLGQKPPESALHDLDKTIDAINQAYPGRYNAGRHIALFPPPSAYRHSSATESFGAVMYVFLAAVVLLGCVNIGMVFFAQFLERRQELALRNALGASRWRLLRQSLSESSVVVLLGLPLGIALAAVGVARIQTAVDKTSADLGQLNDLVLVIRPFSFVVAVLVAAAMWLLSTLIPAWRIAQQDAAVVLAGSGKGSTNRGSARGANFLVGLQVIISCLVLLVCGSIVLMSRDLSNEPTGLDSQNMTVAIGATTFSTRYDPAELRLQYFDALAAQIKDSVPGVEVAFAEQVPANSKIPLVPTLIEAQDSSGKRESVALRLDSVSDNYFKTLGIAVRSGRAFDSTDNHNSLAVAIVDENLARRYWPNNNPLGQRVQLNPLDNGPWLTIVGVTSHVGAATGGDQVRNGLIYRPMRQATPATFHVIVKSPQLQAVSHSALAAAAFAVDRDLPLSNLRPLDNFLAAQDEPYRTMMPTVVGATAFCTAFLAATGLFGIIGRSVALRRQEIGVRRALGATKWQVTAIFLRQGALYLGAGLVFGGGLGILITNALTAAMPAILDHIVAATVGVFLSLSIVILSASYLPTRRAVALEPGDALRYE